MPFLMKWTIIFENKARDWTESLWRNSPDGNLWNEIDPMFSYATVRAGMLGQGALVKALRPSIESDNAGNPVIGDSISNMVAVAGNGQKPIENQDDALLTTWHTADGRRRRQMYLRGIWQEITGPDGRFLVTAAFDAAFGAWYQKILDLQLGWVGRTALNTASITNYTPTTDFRVTFTLNQDLFTPAQVAAPTTPVRVTVRGLNVKSNLNGTVIVYPNTARSCTTVKPIAVFPFASPGKMTNYTYSLILPGTPPGSTRRALIAMRIVERRPGAPLFESRGRRAARARG